jgi:hypothetical protein
MSMATYNQEERRQFGRRWTRWLVLLAVLAGLGWMVVTAYHFRAELTMDLRLLWDNRSQVAGEYLPMLTGVVPSPPAAVPVEDVLRARVTRPVAGQVWIADVLVGNAVRELQDIAPLIVLPGLALLVAGIVVALMCGRVMRRIEPRDFGRTWPAIAVPAVLAFGAGIAFGIAAFRFRGPLQQLLGL